MLYLFFIAALSLGASGTRLQPFPKNLAFDVRVLGGGPAGTHESAFQAALFLENKLHCTGSIISSNAVLTAAHCIEGTESSQWKIRLGFGKGVQYAEVQKLIRHPDFNSKSFDSDISILVLKSPLSLGSKISAVRIPEQDSGISDGSVATVTGWAISPEQFYKIDIPIVNQQLCVNAHILYNDVTSKMVCAGRFGIGGQPICQELSGSPLVIDDVLQGITSWGRGCSRPEFPGVYTRVASFRKWIDEMLTRV